MKPDAAAEENGASRRFTTTRWSVILSCAGKDGQEEKVKHALGELCRTYWRPIFSFVCRRGYSMPDAQDLTQDFFVMVLEGNLLQRADSNRGRFRTYLLHALQNFLNDAAEKKRARKRGGGIQFVSWDDWMAEAPSRLSIPRNVVESWSPERLFDLRWAATVAERALRQLTEECESHGRRRIFDALSGYLTAERSDVSYADISAVLKVPEASVKRLLHRFRQRYRLLLREEVRETVEKPADVDDEIRHLCAVLARGAA